MTFQLPESAQLYRSAFLMTVTPDMAQHWLKRNYFNRKINLQTVYRYRNQILAGRWKRTHQGIAFDKDGILLDGQHRLAAVCMAKRPVQMLVFVNQSLGNHEAIDGGKPRSNLDVIKMEFRDNRLSTAHLTTLRAMLAGKNCECINLSSEEINDEFEHYSEGIQFAIDELETGYCAEINDPTVRAVIARAFAHIPKEKLQAFCSYLRFHQEQPPIVAELCHWLIRLTDHRESTRREIYKRTEYTLLAFLQEQDKVTIPFYTRELFPLI